MANKIHITEWVGLLDKIRNKQIEGKINNEFTTTDVCSVFNEYNGVLIGKVFKKLCLVGRIRKVGKKKYNSSQLIIYSLVNSKKGFYVK